MANIVYNGKKCGLYVRKVKGINKLTTNILGDQLMDVVEIDPSNDKWSDFYALKIHSDKGTINIVDIAYINRHCTYAEILEDGTYHQFAPTRRARKGGATATAEEVFKSVCADLGGAEVVAPTPTNDPTVCEEIADMLFKFFSEFGFTPTLRMLNTLTRLKASKSAMKNYCKSYFDLQDHMSKAEIFNKMKSAEFNAIIDSIYNLPYLPTEKVNTRISILYGPPSGGKSTRVEGLLKGGAMITCNSSMFPSDLMEDFDFVEGKATFKWSPFALAMMNGEKVGLDEINLAPFETLRFLQGLTDNKGYIDYKGKRIEIKEGFKIYGTMNLYVGGIAYPLPEPLVDRGENLELVEPTPKFVAKGMC